MKRSLILFITCTSIIIACSKKTVPSTGTTNPPPAETVKTEPAKTEVTPVTPTGGADVAAGKNIYITKCTKCHAEKTVSNWTFSEWESILRNMVPKARLSTDEEAQVTAYIKANAKQ